MMSVMDSLFFQSTSRISENVTLQGSCQSFSVAFSFYLAIRLFNLLKPTGYVMHQQV